MADLMQVDALQLYFGDDYVINEKIIMHQPKVGDIVRYGEREYYSMIYTITATPSSMKSQLFDLGIDWMKISDFELFIMLSQTMTQERTGIIFDDLDFSTLNPYNNPQNDQIVLANKETGVIIDTLIYERIANYLRKLHGIKKIVETAYNEITKKVLIEEDRQKLEINKNKPYESFLLPLVSSVKVRQGYRLEYVKNMGLYEFMDDVNRLQVIHNADALLQGCYAGTIDMSKINKKDLNWMKELANE